MSTGGTRMRRAGRSDEGAALIAALLVISVIAVLVTVVLQYTYVGIQNTTATSSTGKVMYAADGVTDGAVRALITNQYAGLAPGGSTACFPINEKINAVASNSVTCAPRSGSGAVTIGSAALNSQPQHAVNALGTGTEGFQAGSASTTLIDGDVATAGTVNAGAGSATTVRGTVTGATCTGSGVTIPASYCPWAAPADPGPAAPASWGQPTAYPLTATVPVGCPAGVLITLTPGSYFSSAALQALINCTGKIIWFQPGIYYFEFPAASPELTFNSTTSAVVAGTPTGGTATTIPAAWTSPAAVPPNAGSPGASACDATQQGVEFVLGGPSRFNVTSGRVQICSYIPSGNTAQQHVAFYGPTADLPFVGTLTATGSGTATDTARVGAGRIWTPSTSAVDGNFSLISLPNPSVKSDYLNVGGFGTVLPPGTNTAISVSATLTYRLSGTTGNLFAYVDWPGNPATGDAGTLIASCPGAACTGGTLVTPAFTASNLTAAQIAGMTVVVYADNVANQKIDVSIDGATVTTTFSRTMIATTPTGTYDYTSASRAPVLAASGGYGTGLANTGFAIHGTVYLPLGAVDMRVTGSPYTLIDRGLVARHFYTAMTVASAAATQQALIAIPQPPRNPRRVLITPNVNGIDQLLADVTFTDVLAPGGTANGPYPHVTQWSRQN